MKLNPDILDECKILYKNQILDINSWYSCDGNIMCVNCDKIITCDDGVSSTSYNFAPIQIKPVSIIALGDYDPDTPYLIEPEKDGARVASDKTEPVGDLWAVEQLEYEKAFVEVDETVEQAVPVGKNKTDTASNCLTNIICNVRLVLPNVGTLEAPLAEFLVARDNGAKIEFAFVKESDK